MSVASEITRLQNAKASLKTSINAKTDNEHQITNETIDDFSDFVDSIQTSGGGLDWSSLGYNQQPQSITNDYNYAKQIQSNWTPATNLTSKFASDTKLVYMPLVDTSTATTMFDMFNGCINLTTVAQFNTSKVENMRGLFSACVRLTTIPLLDTSSVTGSVGLYQFVVNVPLLTDESLDNVLQMCINAKNYSGVKTLARVGLTSTNYSTSRIQALPHYEDFITAGWTIGY